MRTCRVYAILQMVYWAGRRIEMQRLTNKILKPKKMNKAVYATRWPTDGHKDTRPYRVASSRLKEEKKSVWDLPTERLTDLSSSRDMYFFELCEKWQLWNVSPAIKGNVFECRSRRRSRKRRSTNAFLMLDCINYGLCGFCRYSFCTISLLFCVMPSILLFSNLNHVMLWMSYLFNYVWFLWQNRFNADCELRRLVMVAAPLLSLSRGVELKFNTSYYAVVCEIFPN